MRFDSVSSLCLRPDAGRKTTVAQKIRKRKTAHQYWSRNAANNAS